MTFPFILLSRIEKDAAFYFVCYLFMDKTCNGSDRFIREGFRGSSIVENFNKTSMETSALYKARFTHSLDCLNFLLRQGLAFRGPDESETLSNKDENVNKVVLKNAPGNSQMTYAEIQHNLIHTCAKEKTKLVLEDIERLAICLRYVDKKRRIRESFLGVVKVEDTCSLSLKIAIEKMVEDKKLSMSRVRGQGYNGASNMRGEINGLKTLIMNDTPFAYYIHCFAHQLQLTLIAVAKDNYDCKWFFEQVGYLLNLMGAKKIVKGLELGEIKSGKCLNQELGLARPGDTRWGSYYKTNLNIISLYPSIFEVLIMVRKTERLKKIRDEGWEEFFSNVSTFCFKHDIEKVTNLHRFRVDMFISIIDLKLYELNNRFDELKLRRLAEFYPADFSSTDLRRLEFQLDHFIDDMWKDVRFKAVQDLGQLSTMLVYTNKHSSYQLVYLLLRLVLIFPMATASVERVFSSMTYVKNKLRNSMCDESLNDSLVTFIERDFFFKVVNDDIISRFQSLRTRRSLLPPRSLV
ncbi:hypothetical protein RND81_02G173100 [Saponaria officinalis]|uniref:HAT C-terminal dimerisation domain-containing protein n=1 Tax=Saponaria officinalis TaxID=3572 RepID=A0AAW1MUZ6_SAPOF